jgi:hypothetical protein
LRYIIFDRSRNEAYQKCCRLRFIQYEYPNGTETHGIQKQAIAVPLLTGATVHKGLEAFASGQQENEAVQIALDDYDANIIQRGIELELPDENSPESFWTIKVQRLICEALTRGWIRYVWPGLQAEFDVVDVEREERLEIALDEETMAVLLARSDLIMRRKADGRHFVFNHKTINEPSDRKLQTLRYDTQTISEVLAAQQRYDMADLPAHRDVQIDGVIYDLLIKGPKRVEYPKGSGVWHNNSPLVWCYVKEGQTGVTEDEIAARFEYTCTAPHQMYRKVCPGNAFHRLGPQWQRKLVSEVFGADSINAWFEWLDKHEPELLHQQF